MRVPLKELTYLSEEELFQTIISSADEFPGLYRMSTSWKNSLAEKHFLKLISFLEIAHLSGKGQKWSKDEWFESHLDLFQVAYGKDSRNEQRKEQDLKELLKEKGRMHFSLPRSFSLALIDNINPVEKIECDQTYYMMGSLIHFTSDQVFISYDDLTQESGHILNLKFEYARAYIEKVFSSESLGKLFLNAQIIAHLNFVDLAPGELFFNPDQLPLLLSRFPLNCPVFAAPDYKTILPIRFAKPLGVSNVLA